MNKEEFNNLGEQDQINFINKELEEKSLTKISEEIKISRKTLRNRFNKFGYVYNKQINRYALKPIIMGEERFNDARNVNVLLEQIKALEGRLNTLEDKVNKSEIGEIESKEIKITPLTGETVSRCYRLNKEIQKEFSSFCKKNSIYKVQDILGCALLEFMEKYK
ncbi:hypothetical protein [Terrisporobacter sp.]